MLKQVEKTINEFSLIKPQDRIVVAVSGGVDSVALLYSLFEIQEKYQVSLIVAHLDHMFRGAESEKDADYVRQLSEKLGLIAVVERINIAKTQLYAERSPQDAARIFRYRFLLETARKYDCNKIALGHHQDDQAETLIMNFIKGTGLDGLKGIAPLNNKFIRPLLFVNKAQIERYCQSKHLIPRVDASNKQDTYLRNRIRNRLLPMLREQYNPNIVEALSKTAEIVREESSYMQKIGKEFEVKSRTKTCNDQVKTWNTYSLSSLPIAIQRRFLREAYHLASGLTQGPSFDHIEAVREMIMKRHSGKSITLPAGIMASYRYDTLTLAKKVEKEGEKQPFFYHELPVPGELYIKELGITCTAVFYKGTPTKFKAKDHEVLITLVDEKHVILRSKMAGDRIKPSGMMGTKKVKNIFIDSKIPREKRNRIPIVQSKKTGEIIWVAGHCLSRLFQPAEGKKNVLITLNEKK